MEQQLLRAAEAWTCCKVGFIDEGAGYGQNQPLALSIYGVVSSYVINDSRLFDITIQISKFERWRTLQVGLIQLMCTGCWAAVSRCRRDDRLHIVCLVNMSKPLKLVLSMAAKLP